MREKFISSISPLLACQAQARPPPVCQCALLTQMSTVKGALHLPPGASCRPGTRPSVAMLPTGPLQEPRLPHLRNCQNLTEYFITWIGHGGCSSHGQVWQILDCLPDDKSQLSETCRLHSICGTCFLPPSQQKRLGLAFRGPSPGRKGPRFHNLNICRPSQQAEITALAEQPPSPSDPFRTFLWKKLGNSRHNEKSKR